MSTGCLWLGTTRPETIAHGSRDVPGFRFQPLAALVTVKQAQIEPIAVNRKYLSAEVSQEWM
jgi:hypothetical protein